MMKWCVKTIIYHDQVDLFQICKYVLILRKLFPVIDYMIQKNHMSIFIGVETSFDKIITTNHD